MRLTPVLILAACGVAGNAQDQPTFEVASLKPVNSQGDYSMWLKGGPGSDDPTRIDYHNVSTGDLISMAHGIANYQLTGPDWLMSDKYDLEARLATGTTREQFRAMLQKLVTERFKLQVHRDQKELPQYSLTVAKGGPKFKEHGDTVPPPDDPSKPPAGGPIKTDSEGYPILPAGTGMAMSNGRARMRFEDKDVDYLAGMLAGQLDAPVSNETALTGKYDFQLQWSFRMRELDNAPDLIAAVQEQLGLKLERKKGPVNVVVVDHIQRVPVEN